MKTKYYRPGTWLFDCATRVWAVFREGTTRDTHLFIVQHACCGMLRIMSQRSLYNKNRAQRKHCSACQAEKIRIRGMRESDSADERVRSIIQAMPHGVNQPLWDKPPSATGGIWEDSRS